MIANLTFLDASVLQDDVVNVLTQQLPQGWGAKLQLLYDEVLVHQRTEVEVGRGFWPPWATVITGFLGLLSIQVAHRQW